MKVDNFVLLIISIVTLIVISLLTECNRGRLTELENKATKEIVETFFHLGSADPTEPGQWGYQITGITEGKYGGRSKQEILNNIGGHNKGDYITESEKEQYGSGLFDSTISGREEDPVDCDLTIGSSTNINMIPYHHVQPNNNYSYGGLNCQDKYGSDYIYQDTNYNLYNIPTIFGIGSNINNIPDNIELSDTIKITNELENEVLDTGSLDMSMNITIDSTLNIASNLLQEAADINSIARRGGCNNLNIQSSYRDSRNTTKEVKISKQYPIDIIYNIKLKTDNSKLNQYYLEIEVKISPPHTIEPYLFSSVGGCGPINQLVNTTQGEVNTIVNSINNNLDSIVNSINTIDFGSTIHNRLQNQTYQNNKILLYKFTSNTINNNNEDEISFSNFNLENYNINYENIDDLGNNFKIKLTKTDESGSGSGSGSGNNYTISIIDVDSGDFGATMGPNISQFKNISITSIQNIFNEIIQENLEENLQKNNSNYTMTTSIVLFNLYIDNNGDKTNILHNLEVKNILSKLDERTINLN